MYFDIDRMRFEFDSTKDLADYIKENTNPFSGEMMIFDFGNFNGLGIPLQFSVTNCFRPLALRQRGLDKVGRRNVRALSFYSGGLHAGNVIVEGHWKFMDYLQFDDLAGILFDVAENVERGSYYAEMGVTYRSSRCLSVFSQKSLPVFEISSFVFGNSFDESVPIRDYPGNISVRQLAKGLERTPGGQPVRLNIPHKNVRGLTLDFVLDKDRHRKPRLNVLTHFPVSYASVFLGEGSYEDLARRLLSTFTFFQFHPDYLLSVRTDPIELDIDGVNATFLRYLGLGFSKGSLEDVLNGYPAPVTFEARVA